MCFQMKLDQTFYQLHFEIENKGDNPKGMRLIYVTTILDKF